LSIPLPKPDGGVNGCFFTGMAVLSALTAFIGFYGSYYLQKRLTISAAWAWRW
jgi:hypothetical protein